MLLLYFILVSMTIGYGNNKKKIGHVFLIIKNDMNYMNVKVKNNLKIIVLLLNNLILYFENLFKSN